MADPTDTTHAHGSPREQVLFGPRGHGAIAAIAVADLGARDASLRARVEGLLESDPLGRADTFVAANWPDRIRGEQPETRVWHFIDIPYDPSRPDAEPEVPAAPHAVSAIEAQTAAWFAARARAEASEASEEDRAAALAEQVTALCWLLHLYGDVHQPLHCVARVTPEFPDGDRGGNSVKLNGHWRNLHSLWDDSVNLLAEDRAEVLAEQIMAKHSRASLPELSEASPLAWAFASRALAIRHAYTLPDGEDAPPPPLTYLRKAMEVAQRQAALGGYRLADKIASLFAGSNDGGRA